MLRRMQTIIAKVNNNSNNISNNNNNNNQNNYNQIYQRLSTLEIVSSYAPFLPQLCNKVVKNGSNVLRYNNNNNKKKKKKKKKKNLFLSVSVFYKKKIELKKINNNKNECELHDRVIR